METIRTSIAYRPLRIGWMVRSGDMEGFRTAVRLSFAFWGGTFNPIIVADREGEAESLVDLFRLDMVYPITDSEEIQFFVKQFPYLIRPFFPDHLFLPDGWGGARSHVLDIHNALAHHSRQRTLEELKQGGVHLHTWEPDDPLSDVFLMHFGGYPNSDEVKIDYRKILKEATSASEIWVKAGQTLPANILEFATSRSISRLGLERHYDVRAGWDYPGFFYGDAGNFDDLVCYWNLRASDIPLLFVDPDHLARYSELLPRWGRAMQEMASRRLHKFDQQVAVWTRTEESNTREGLAEILALFNGHASTICRVSEASLNGFNVRPPMMCWSEVSTLGVMGSASGHPRVSFALDEKPFCGDNWFHTQHLVASVNLIGGLYGDYQHTFSPPFLPELNEFYARTMHFEYNKLRSESERLGLIVDAADESSFITAMPVADLFEHVFELAGFSSKLSAGGLIARQLITQLGGVDGARVFKVPGVRQLLKTYGPTTPFTKKGALTIIGSKGTDSTFKDHENLYIEPRPHDTKLDPAAVFTYLVEKGLFRIGAELTCPNCRMASWTPLDVLKQRVACELCGKEFDATRQLVNGEWHYRRSGVLGAEKNAQGAIPVVMTLQQFDINLGLDKGIYSPSLNLRPKDRPDLPVCEVDFVWMIPRRYPDRTVVMIGECKDSGMDTINSEDIDHLRQVADALPEKRFETFVVLAKLCPFTTEEIELARTLNDPYRQRAILLTARELEPYHLYDRTKLEFNYIREHAMSPQDLAATSARIYFPPTIWHKTGSY